MPDDFLAPIFSEVTDETALKKPAQQIVQKPEYPQKITRRISKDLSGPSIKDALNGKFGEEKISVREQHGIYSQSNENQLFTEEALREKWLEFLKGLEDRPNLRSTLSTVPALKEDFILEMEIENSIQNDLIGGIKPELVSWLRRELRNSKINLVTRISEQAKGKIIYSDADKYEEMVRKNPALNLLKQKFNLDFGH